MADSKSASTLFFNTYPAAPAARAVRKYAGSECIVRSRTLPDLFPFKISAMACRPPDTGIVISSSTTSGLISLAVSIACCPFCTSATTAISGCALINMRKPARRIAWSSAIMTRILLSLVMVTSLLLERPTFAAPEFARSRSNLVDSQKGAVTPHPGWRLFAACFRFQDAEKDRCQVGDGTTRNHCPVSRSATLSPFPEQLRIHGSHANDGQH